MADTKPFNGFKQDVELPFQRTSYAKKSANNFKWADDCMDYYDFFNGDGEYADKIKRYQDNINLGVNGRADIAKDYSDLFNFKFNNENISLGIKHVHHFPIVNQVIAGYVGEHIKRPFVPVAYDVSGNTVNYKKKKHLDLLTAYIQEVYVQPAVQKATQEAYQKYRIQDPYSLGQEEQDKLMAEIDQNAAASLPENINRFMKTEYKSPEETQCQKLLDFLMRDQRIKEKADDSFVVGLCTGEIYYYVDIRHNKPVFERVNPAYFEWGGSQNVTRSEDGEWAKYTQYLTISEAFNKYGDIFSAADLKRLQSLFGLSKNSAVDDVVLANNTLLEINATNPKIAPPTTKEGQWDMANLFSTVATKLGVTSGELSQIRLRETTFAWKALRKLVKVKKLTPEGIKWYYFDETYQFSPLDGDIESQDIWVPEVWRGVKLGVQDAVYVKKGPLEYQYSSVMDPWDVKLPFIGQRLNTTDGMTKNSSIVDLGKVWNFQFDVFMARILEKISTDVGKILTFMVEAKPENIQWKDWFAMMKYGKLAPLTFKDFMEGQGLEKFPVFKAEDLSQAFELAQMIPALQYFQAQTATSMLYNPSRLGQISPYVPVSNNEQNIQQSSNQTERIFNQHNQILERALTQLVECARIAYKDYKEVLTWVLDDGSIAELELDTEMLSRAKLGVFISTTPMDIESTLELKRYLLEIIQNPQADLKTVVNIMYAKNKADMVNAAEEAQARKQDEAQQQQQAAMAQQQQMLQAQQQQQQQKDKLTYQMHQENLENKEVITLIDSEKFAKSLDIDKDGINDMTKNKELEIEYKKDKDAKDRELEREKMEHQSAHESEMTDKELEISQQELELEKKSLILQEKQLALQAKELEAKKKDLAKKTKQKSK